MTKTKKEIVVAVEMGVDGTYWGSTQNIPGIVVSEGDTLESLRTEMINGIEANFELAAEYGDDWVKDYEEYSLIFNLDLKSLFDLVPEIKSISEYDLSNVKPTLSFVTF